MAGDPITTFPGNSVVLIESPNPSGDGYLQGSGVVIGPHTILTASHVVYDISEQTPIQNIELYPGWNSTDPALGPGDVPTTYTDHFNEIGVIGSDDLTRAQSASDFAIIDTSYTFSSSMGVLLNYAGGVVTATGYPATAGGLQTNQVGTVSADPSFSVLDYGTLSTSPGNSGGPLWLDFNGSDDVAGIVSTGLWATQITTADWSQIESWVSQDGYSLTANVSPVVTAVPSGTIAVGQSISASSLIASISNPNGDDIANDVYEDLGGGSGYFTVNGVRQADNVWISAAPAENVQYVAGASPGSDTLGVGIHDATTNSNISSSVVATTIHAAPVVTVVPTISLVEGQSVSASSLIASISNPSGDDILEDIYEDLGGGSGYFTVDGLKYLGGIAIDSTSATEVQYVGGSSPGSDALSVGIYDLTTNSFIYASTSVVATTTQAEGNASDILFQNADGQASIWDMSGSTLVGGGPVSPNPGPSWTEIGTGDFNHDGHSDILWQNASGQASIWDMNGNSLIGGGPVSPNPGPAWKAIGTGDFTDDGFADDILWQNMSSNQVSIWEMSENTLMGGGPVSPNPGPAWHAIGIGDFNHDGFSDILWQNTSSGQVSIWEMHGNNLIGGGPVSLNPGPAWHAVGTGDFNHDGFSDILFQNASTGQVSVWEMSGNAVIGGGPVSPNPGTSWHAIGTDGGSDILFQNTSGQASIWDMSGNTLVGGGPVSPNPGPSWRAVGLA